MLDFNRYEWLSFDCYGTLVDWETGISTAVAQALEAHGVSRTPAEILGLFSDLEPRAQTAQGYLEYRSALRGVMALMGEELGLEFSESELGCLADSLPDWPVFPDASAALNTLQSRYKLAIISNVDDDLFAGSARALGIDFDALITSQQVRAYKPDLSSFHAALERMGCARDSWLHIGESLYHDIGPANRMEIASVWVNRPDRGGGTRQTDAVPDLEVSDLAELAGMMCPA
ncbi:MAG: HAD-IA family hydrolase [Chloroflexi bacterium]|nr:HAD-IA family hydrolase [Chloroflexota bacterium]